MTRSSYSDDYEHANLYTANVERSIAGKRGQIFLKELAVMLDAMPEKKLIANKLIDSEGNCCTMGVFCKAKGIDSSKVDYDDTEAVGDAVGITGMMARDIAYWNDEVGPTMQTPEERWTRMRCWVSNNIK